MSDDESANVVAVAERELRGWATEQKLSRKTVDILMKKGCSSMEALRLLDKDDLTNSKMLHGQQKLLLKSLISVQPERTAATCMENTRTYSVIVGIAEEWNMATTCDGNSDLYTRLFRGVIS